MLFNFSVRHLFLIWFYVCFCNSSPISRIACSVKSTARLASAFHISNAEGLTGAGSGASACVNIIEKRASEACIPSFDQA
jgi:hypothetical protein